MDVHRGLLLGQGICAGLTQAVDRGDLVIWFVVVGVLWAAAAAIGYRLGKFIVDTSEWKHK